MTTYEYSIMQMPDTKPYDVTDEPDEYPTEETSFTFPETHDLQIAGLYAAIALHNRNIASFYDDPATEAFGVPTGDFQEDFDRKTRKLLSDLAKRARQCGDMKALKFAHESLETFMP